ncbi:hypothetical protein [Anaeromyxobacter oryzae]|uniref:Uncharacterized protein n=1 Tax=Anaeromyxobacter oryzae TaxID=2918170 RepID=A0ABM7X086_9BACT|nr:hypothetical protein [Anaeromyxobacter oryzae]BDG05198.1 hypothetical protein AMOR_41940 [Anaeromyxobacter oryzae]
MDVKAMTMLGDEALTAVSGGHKKCKRPSYKRVEQTVTQTQSESVDIGGDLSLSGGSSVTISFGDQSQSASQSA